MTDERIDWIANAHCATGVAYPNDVKLAIKEALREAARATAEQSRDSVIEECANVCNMLSLQHTPTHENYAADACIECADAIRALKSQQDAAIESQRSEK